MLKAVGADNPAAKVLVDISIVEDDEVGDVTTSVAVLASELLKEAELLVSMKIHSQTIIAGWRKATDEAHKALTATAATDNSNVAQQFAVDLTNIARTTLGSKILSQQKDFFHSQVGSGRCSQIEETFRNTPMDTFKINAFGSRVHVDSMAKVAELEVGEKVKMKENVDQILKHEINVFINRH